MESVKDASGENRFTYVTAVTRLAGNKSAWENYGPFREALGGNPIAVLTFREMISEILNQLTTTLAATKIGRLLQLFSAAGVEGAEK